MITEPRNGKHWLERNWKWFVPVGCLGFVILSAAFFVGIFLLAMTWIRSSHVFEEAMDRARNDPRVVRELGEPIRTGWWLLGNIHTSGSSGTADLTIPISGPRNSARIYLEAEKRAGVWNFEYLVVEIGGSGERLDLLELPENWIQTMRMRRRIRHMKGTVPPLSKTGFLWRRGTVSFLSRF